MEKVLREGQSLRKEAEDRNMALGRTYDNGCQDKSTFQIRN